MPVPPFPAAGEEKITGSSRGPARTARQPGRGPGDPTISGGSPGGHREQQGAGAASQLPRQAGWPDSAPSFQKESIRQAGCSSLHSEGSLSAAGGEQRKQGWRRRGAGGRAGQQVTAPSAHRLHRTSSQLQAEDAPASPLNPQPTAAGRHIPLTRDVHRLVPNWPPLNLSAFLCGHSIPDTWSWPRKVESHLTSQLSCLWESPSSPCSPPLQFICSGSTSKGQLPDALLARNPLMAAATFKSSSAQLSKFFQIQ